MLKHTLTLLLLATTMSILPNFANAQTTAQSSYTSLKEKDCKLIESIEDEAGFYRAKCPSLGGYAIESSGQDMRNWVDVKYGKKTLSYATYVPSNIGDKIEWRYTQNGKQKNYHAMIYRVYLAQLKDGEVLSEEHDKQSLVVIRLAKQNSCVLGVIPASPTMNSQARKLADNITAKCLPEE